jgi:hypothetical protein
MNMCIYIYYDRFIANVSIIIFMMIHVAKAKRWRMDEIEKWGYSNGMSAN